MRTTKKELTILWNTLAEVAGSRNAAVDALHSARNALGEKVTLGPYVDGAWTASWFEGHKETTRWRRIRVTAAEIVSGSVVGLVRDTKRGE